MNTAVNKFQYHPSVIKIKERVETTDVFTLSLSTEQDITKAINQRNTNKPTTFNNIPVKIVVENNDMCVPLITKCDFPNALNMTDITPAHTKR